MFQVWRKTALRIQRLQHGLMDGTKSLEQNGRRGGIRTHQPYRRRMRGVSGSGDRKRVPQAESVPDLMGDYIRHDSDLIIDGFGCLQSFLHWLWRRTSRHEKPACKASCIGSGGEPVAMRSLPAHKTSFVLLLKSMPFLPDLNSLMSSAMPSVSPPVARRPE